MMSYQLQISGYRVYFFMFSAKKIPAYEKYKKQLANESVERNEDPCLAVS